ncbi:MAG: globin [Actinobacteria bacterium]|jgi:hemoglobin|nr:globin [Actinomycetota bacterium]NBP53460.1 globin [Actinomycetota bacterium]
MSTDDRTVYDVVGGMDFFVALADRFYDRVRDDAVLLPLYPDPDDLPAASRRLAMFLAQYWGGPHAYSEERGHPMLRARHNPYVIGALERDHWLVCMLSAVNELVTDDDVRAQMTDYFVKAAEHLRNDQPLRLVKP